MIFITANIEFSVSWYFLRPILNLMFRGGKYIRIIRKFGFPEKGVYVIYGSEFLLYVSELTKTLSAISRHSHTDQGSYSSFCPILPDWRHNYVIIVYPSNFFSQTKSKFFSQWYRFIPRMHSSLSTPVFPDIYVCQQLNVRRQFSLKIGAKSEKNTDLYHMAVKGNLLQR